MLSEWLCNFYSSQNIIRVSKWRIKRWAERVARTADIINAYIVLIRKSEGKGSLSKPRRR